MSHDDDARAHDAMTGANVVMPSPATLQTPGARSWTVLCVDDEPSILSALRRVLRAEGCRLLTAPGGVEALAILATESVDVVVSDMRMPGMDGAQLLARVREHWPGTARILLTGYADMDATIAAINHGQIYRYIHKPWDENELRLTVRQAAEHQALQRDRERLQHLTQVQNEELQALNTGLEQRVAERTAELGQAHDRLKKNYLTTIRVFAGLLEMRSGLLGGHGKRVADLARRIAVAMEVPSDQVQDIFVAGLLHDMGFMAVPDTLLAKPVGRYTPEEMQTYQRHAALGAQSLMALDDMQNVATLIRSHHERFDGKGYPDKISGSAIPLGSRILAVADTWDDFLYGHLTGAQLKQSEAQTLMQRARGIQFDPEVVDVILQVTQVETPRTLKLQAVSTEELTPGMVLGKDFTTPEGVVLLAAGQKLTQGLVDRIRRYEQSEGRPLDLQVREAS